MSDYTPGPWKHEVWDYPSATPPRKELEIVTDDALLATIAWDEGRDNPYTIKHDEAMANAHLIAAAPDLLEALEAVETELLSDRFNLSGQTQDQIRAAIIKAKGGQHE